GRRRRRRNRRVALAAGQDLHRRRRHRRQLCRIAARRSGRPAQGGAGEAEMTSESALVLVALGLVAFALRGGGMLLGGLMPSTGKGGQFLRELPGTIMMSLAAPIVASGGPAEWLATAVTGVVAWFTRSL